MAVFGVGGTPLFLARTARAATLQAQGKRKVLVAIFQRGAMDGLMAVTPFADPAMREMRPRLGMDAASTAGDAALIDLDGRFGLHPGFADLAPFFRSGQLAIVHGVGSPNPTRSHFDAQDYMETGTPGVKGTQSGWLNRASGLLGHDRTPFCSCSMTPALPRSLYGNEPALAIANLADFAINARPTNVVAQSAGQMLESLYDETSQRLLQDTGRESFDAAKTLSKTQAMKYVPSNGAVYPNGPLGNGLKQVSQIIKADLGLEIAFVESVGWDTHVAQGTVNGTFAQRAKELAGTISAFWTDLGSAANDVILMTMTEFGRTVHENGSGGTDHGRGSCMFVLGGEVAGGKVYGTVPALVKENLEDGRDLPVTTDFRSVFSAVAGGNFHIEDDATMFPGWTGNRIGIMRA
jgi:uncharacterized protein (DUF1501 family)